MRLLKNALAALAVLCLAAGPAFAADNVAVTPGTGKTMACKDVAGVCYSQHVPVDSTGADMSDTTLHAAKTAQQASEVHAFEVGGNLKALAQVTPTTTAVLFTTGWAVGGLQSITSASRVSGGTGLLQSVQVLEKTAQTATFDIFLFSDTSLSSTCTNAAAFVLSASDFAKVVGVVHVTDITAGNTTTVAQALNLAQPYTTAVTTLYACAVVRGTPTWGSTTDLTFSYNFIRN